MAREFNRYEVRFQGLVEIQAGTAKEAAERVKATLREGRIRICLENSRVIVVRKTAEVTEFDADELKAVW